MSTELIELRLSELSSRIRRGRTDDGLSLAELSDRSGVAASTIQKIENRQMIPSITVILKIAHGLGMEAGDLIAPASPAEVDVILQRAGRHAKIFGSNGWQFVKLGADIMGSEVESWRIIVAAGRQLVHPRPMRVEDQVIICERGNVELTFASQTFSMHTGDTLHCRSQLLQKISNPGSKEAVYTMTGRFPHGASFTGDETAETKVSAPVAPRASARGRSARRRP